MIMTMFYVDDFGGHEEKIVVDFPPEHFQPMLVPQVLLRKWLEESLGDDGSGNIDDCMTTHTIDAVVHASPHTCVLVGTYEEMARVHWSLFVTLNKLP